MCGISGYVNLGEGIDVSVLKKMTDIIKYRGPDDEGFVLVNDEKIQYTIGTDTAKGISYPFIEEFIKNDNVYLGMGHRRLSILDLSILGHQPMEKHNRILVFNGEIYNYIELKKELETKGYGFTSQSDTEVLLSAYDYWGKDCVRHFNGMWAFAIYDYKVGELFLSRDRFGIKPLYYYFDTEKLLFGSEIKQLLCEKNIKVIANNEIIAHHLRYSFREYSEQTFFKNIYTLPGGCNAVIKIDLKNKQFGEMAINRYYDIRKITLKSVQNPAEYIGEQLRRAIKIRMRSDVKIGSCLSGGLDSSSIVGIVCDEMSKGYNEKILTITSCFPEDKEIDETYYSKLVVKNCGCEENLVKTDIYDLMKDLEKIVWHQDEPLPHLGGEVSYSIFRMAAKKGCKVFFDGQGGDEGLCGYYSYYANYLWNIFKNNIFQFFKEFKKILHSSELSIIKIISYIFYFNVPCVRKFLTGLRRNCYLSKKTLNSINQKNLQIFFSPKDGVSRQIEDFLYGSLPGILHWEDRYSMASSVETRLPFLDYKYVESVLGIDITKKLEKGYTKKPLRDYVENILPKEVVWRKNKLGFTAPTQKWLKQMPRDYVLNLLENPVSAPFFNIEILKKAYLKGKKDLEMMEKFILIELWMRIYEVEVE